MIPVRFVSFDVTDTLIHVHPSVGEHYFRHGVRRGVRFSAGSSAAALDSAFGRVLARHAAAAPIVGARAVPPVPLREFWRRVVVDTYVQGGALAEPRAALDAAAADLFDAFAGAACWRPFADTRASLRRLRAEGLKLAVTSNFDSRLHTVLRELQLEREFEFVLTSYELGAEKPEPAIWQELLRRFGVQHDPGAVLHVGDSRRRDYEGALAAGMRGLLFEHRTDNAGAHHITLYDQVMRTVQLSRTNNQQHHDNGQQSTS